MVAVPCRLVSPEILRLVSGDARMVYVGKNRGYHTRTQTEIHELLCEFAEQGSRVIRLKGGDPFIFGRGGEEMQYLQQRGIKVHTVPGKLSHITSHARCFGHLSSKSQLKMLPSTTHLSILPSTIHARYLGHLSSKYHLSMLPSRHHGGVWNLC